MTIRELIVLLNAYNPDMIVTISGLSFGEGCDFELEQVHRFDNEDTICLIPGKRCEE
jgi:hypothetical protein